MPALEPIRSCRLLLLLFSLHACVPKGAHEVAIVQLEATRSALSARTAQCIEEGSQAEARYFTLLEEINARQLQLDELVARGEALDQELAVLQASQLALIDELAEREAEVAALNAEILKMRKGKPPAASPAVVPNAAMLARDDIKNALAAHLAEEVEHRRLVEGRETTIVAFAPLVSAGRAEVVARGDHTVVRIPTGMLFQEGFTTLSPRGSQIVDDVVAALRAVPGRYLTVEAHTDDRPVHTAELPSNWERGFAYAIAVLRALESAEAPARLSAASFAATRPLVDNSGAEREKNERIELFLRIDPEIANRFAPTPLPELPAPEPSPLPPQ